MELKTSSSFKTIGLLQLWQTLCKIFSKCLTTRVTRWDQPPLQIMQMMYCFVNNIHVDYVKLPWEGLYYSLHHPTSLIPYLRFTKIIISHYMTSFPKISRRTRDMYHNLQDDDIMKNIFNLGRHKDKVGMQIPNWMITEEMKQTEYYRMYAEVFRLDVPLTQSQPIESTQGTHRTPSAPRSPNPKMDAAESSAPKRSIVIRFRLPERKSTRLTPPAPMPTVDKEDEMILQDTLQVCLAENKSQEEQEARENVELVNKHLASEEIEKMVEGSENVIDDSLHPRNDEPNIPGTRLEPRSDKESPEVEITNAEEVEITNVVIPVNVNEEEEEITNEVYELKRREKGKIIEESRSTPFPTLIRSPRIHTDLVSLDTEKLQELTETVTKITPSSRSSSTKLSKTNRLLSLFKAKPARKSFDTLVDHLQEVMVESLPTLVDMHIKEQVKKQFPEQMKFESLQVLQTTCRPSAVRLRDQDDPHDDAHPKGENIAKRQKTSEYEAYVSGESSSGQVNEKKRGPSTLGNQEQVDDYDFWTDSYASDDDKIPMKQVSEDIIEEVSLTIDEAKLKKMADEMLRRRCTSRDEHQYHIDQMKNFLKSDIVWESKKEILASTHLRKTTPLVQSCQRDPKAPALSLINQDLLYLKKGNSGPEKIVLSLHKFPAIIFNDVDIEERSSRWVNKYVKKFNPYARYGVEHYKNPHAKIFYIKRQKKPGKPKEVVYSNSKIIQVPDYAETGLLWSLSVFIRSSVIWERVHDFQLGIERELKVINRKLISLHQQYLSQELKSTKCSPSSMSPCMESYTRIARKRKGDEYFRDSFYQEEKPSTDSMLKSLLNICDLDCGRWWVALGIASSIGLANFDSLIEEFSDELAHIDLISPKIDEANFDPEEEIRLVEKLLYDNLSPRPLEELNSENSDAVIESFSPSPILVEDSDSLMKEIDIFLAPDGSIPSSIKNDDYDSEGDILFLKELLSNDSLSLPENESFYFDRYYDPSSPRPPIKPLDDDGIYFDIEPDTGILTAKVVDDISEHYVLMPSILPTHPTRYPVIDTLLSFSSKNENKVFNYGILASKEEKSPHILSHRGFKAFQLIFYFSERSMMIYEGNIPILDVSIASDFEASRARGFVLHSLELQSLA
ncbi:hypothetical protein Tco_1402101 [Tanacetum coccineum]